MEIYDEDKHNLGQLIQQGFPIVIQFSAKWCGPCKKIRPDVEELAREKSDVRFFYVDVDEYEDISGSDGYNISKLPTFLIFKRGKEPVRLEGSYIDALRKSI